MKDKKDSQREFCKEIVIIPTQLGIWDACYQMFFFIFAKQQSVKNDNKLIKHLPQKNFAGGSSLSSYTEN